MFGSSSSHPAEGIYAGVNAKFNSPSVHANPYHHGSGIGTISNSPSPMMIQQPGSQQHNNIYTNSVSNSNSSIVPPSSAERNSSAVATFERNLKSIIERLQEESRLAREELLSTSSSTVMIGYQGEYKRKSQAFKEFLATSEGLLTDGRSLFRDWQVALAGEPFERQKKRLSFERLRQAFEAESESMNTVRRQVQAAQEEFEFRYESSSNTNNSGSGGARGGAYGGLGGGSGSSSGAAPNGGGFLPQGGQGGLEMWNGVEEDQFRHQRLQEDAMAQQRIADERNRGLQRIVGQVGDVQKIFTDLAGVVQEQGLHVAEIGARIGEAMDNTEVAYHEIGKTEKAQRESNRRTFVYLGLAILLLVGICYFWGR